MNPIPISWCLGGAAAAALLGAVGGWTVRDWKRDSEVLAGMNKAIKDANDQSNKALDRGAAFEKSHADETNQSLVRESTIREIYRDHPVPADCAVPASAVGVLDDAIARANARAAGQPVSGLPTDPAATRPVH